MDKRAEDLKKLNVLEGKSETGWLGRKRKCGSRAPVVSLAPSRRSAPCGIWERTRKDKVGGFPENGEQLAWIHGLPKPPRVLSCQPSTKKSLSQTKMGTEGHFLLCQGWTKWLRVEVAKPDTGLTLWVHSALPTARIGLSLPRDFLWPPDCSLLKQPAPRTGQIPHFLSAQEGN